MKRLNIFLALAVAALAFTINCGGGSGYSSGSGESSGGSSQTDGGSGTTETPAPTVLFATQIQPVFDTKCGGSLCHGNNPPVLSSGQSYDNLVNVASSFSAGMTRVIPNDPDNSVLYLRVSGASLGTRMPKTGGVLADDQITLIRTWIAEGALRN